MSMKIWQTVLISAAADGSVHEASFVNPESVPIHIRKVISCRTQNTNCGADSNAWLCLVDGGDKYFTQHFNPPGGGATMQQFDFPADAPIDVGVGEHVEVGIIGTGGGSNMYCGTLIFYTT